MKEVHGVVGEAGHKVASSVQQAADQVQQVMDSTQGSVNDVRGVIRRQPIIAAAAVLVVGYLLGRIV
jgi:hypothetical protein